MANLELVKYVREQTQAGASQETIKATLTTSGWQESDIAEAFLEASNPATSESKPPVAPLPGGWNLIIQSAQIFRQRPGTYVGIMLLPTLILLLAVFAFVFSLLANESFKSVAQTASISGIGLALALVFGIALGVVEIWAQVAVMLVAMNNTEKIGMWEAYRRAYHKVMPYLWIIILSSFVIIGGMILFVVPGIILLIAVSLASYVFLDQGDKGMSALLKSREYTKGYILKLLWRYIVFFCVMMLVMVIPQIIFGMLNVPYADSVINGVTSLFFTPLSLIYSYLIYSNLKNQKADMVFAPTKGQKAKYIAVGIFGFLVVPAILASVVLVSLGSARLKARDVMRETDLKHIRTSLELYYSERAVYPESLEDLRTASILQVPVDPATSKPYEYAKTEEGYRVCAIMESTDAEPKKCVTSSSE